MNPDFPTDPRKALEASLTALMLGELPDDQARFLRQTIATDPELAKAFDRLQKTTELIRETETSSIAEPVAEHDLPKLSENRRNELLRHFKTVQPAEFKERRNRKFSWVMPVAAAAVLTLLLAAMLMPALSRSKTRSMAQGTTKASNDLPTLNQLDVNGLNSRGALVRSGPQGTTGLGSSTVQDEILSRSPSTPVATASSPPLPEEVAAARLRQTIILPPTEPVESLALSANARNPNSAFSAQSQAPIPSLFDREARAANNAAGVVFKGGLGGGGDTAQKPAAIPTLGDEPMAGRMFYSESIATNAPVFLSDKGKNTVEFFGYDDPGAFVPQANLAANGPSGGATPLTASLPVPQFRVRSLAESTGNSKDQLTPGQAKSTETQRTAGTYYGGGTFGGYSSIQPAVPQPGQKVDVITIQGVGDVPVLKELQAEDHERSKVGKEPEVALLTERAEAEKAPSAEGEQKLALLARTDDGKAKVVDEKLQKSEADVNGTRENLKKGVVEPSKNLEAILQKDSRDQQDLGLVKSVAPAPEPQPEIRTVENPFSTFSLNVSDVSFQLAAASLEKGVLPGSNSIRSEEFINAFDYRDPAAPAGVPIAFAWERARFPFAQNRDILRLSIKTAAAGRQAGQPLNVVLLLDNSGSMERADRVRIRHQALDVLATQLRAQDTLSVVTFARTARLWVDGISGNQAGKVADELNGLTPEGGTNLEEAMNLAYQTALRHYAADGINRVVLLTDGAANLGNSDPEALKKKVELNRQQGIALDCFGIGWEGYNDDLLEVLTRNGDGRYGFLNTPEQAGTDFAGQLAGALHVAAADVKLQVEFNTNRVTSYRQIGYARHQLTKEQFRDNKVDAAEIGAAESGNALYIVESNLQGEGPMATVRVRYRLPGSGEYQERQWAVPFEGVAAPLEQASPALRLATTAASFSEWLGASPYAGEITLDRLMGYLGDVPRFYGADHRPQKLEWMLRQAKSLSGK